MVKSIKKNQERQMRAEIHQCNGCIWARKSWFQCDGSAANWLIRYARACRNGNRDFEPKYKSPYLMTIKQLSSLNGIHSQKVTAAAQSGGKIQLKSQFKGERESVVFGPVIGMVWWSDGPNAFEQVQTHLYLVDTRCEKSEKSSVVVCRLVDLSAAP